MNNIYLIYGDEDYFIDKEIKKVCPFCGKEYILRYLTYPCKLEDKRNTTIFCPRCNKNIESNLIINILKSSKEKNVKIINCLNFKRDQ